MEQENNKNIKRAGRKLAYLLRHGDPEMTEVDHNGWMSVNEALKMCAINQNELDYIVENNNKKRFEYDAAKTLIRARQGHSIDVDVELERKSPPEVLYHGTNSESASMIMASGIKSMKRNHVHLSDSEEIATGVGQRKREKTVVLVVEAAKAENNGVNFYLSNNGVWLADYIPSVYVREMFSVN